MPVIFNKKCERNKRRRLRHNIPKAEVLLWQHLNKKQVQGFKFRRQYSIGRYVVDFYCPKVRLAIEIDGPTHLSNKARKYDSKKQEYIESFGIQFMRVTNMDIYENIEGVLESICSTVKKKVKEKQRIKRININGQKPRL